MSEYTDAHITHEGKRYVLVSYANRIFDDSAKIDQLESELQAKEQEKESFLLIESELVAANQKLQQELTQYKEAWERDEQVMEDLRNEIAKRDQTINQLRQKEEALKAEREWIPVDERLPEDSSEVVVKVHAGGSDIACYMNGGWKETYYKDPYDDAITHWMPLPKAPNKGEQK